MEKRGYLVWVSCICDTQNEEQRAFADRQVQKRHIKLLIINKLESGATGRGVLQY